MQNILLIIHVIGASILLGGSIIILLYTSHSFFHNKPVIFKKTLKNTLTINLTLIAPSGLIQLITGFILIALRTSTFNTTWMATTLLTFGVAGAIWLIGLQILGTCYKRATQNFTSLFICWMVLSIVAIGCMLILTLLMSAHAVSYRR